MLLGLDQKPFQKDEISGHGEKAKESKWGTGANFYPSLVARQSKYFTYSILFEDQKKVSFSEFLGDETSQANVQASGLQQAKFERR